MIARKPAVGAENEAVPPHEEPCGASSNRASDLPVILIRVNDMPVVVLQKRYTEACAKSERLFY